MDNTGIITKLLLDCLEKLPFQDVLIPFFIHDSVLAQLFWLKSNPTHGWSQDASLFSFLL